MIYRNGRSLRLLSLILALMMVFTVCGTGALAESAESSKEESGSALPSPSANFYIHDEEEILSSETKSAILTRNASLYEKYGIQIVVLTMKTIPGKDINEKGNYLHQIIDSWQVGGTSEKCLMLMLSVTEQNYVAVAGDGLSAEFPVDTWTTLFTQYLEPDFAAGRYDAGVLKFFNAIADKAELYAVNNSITAAEPTATAEPSAQPEETKKNEDKPGVFETILRVIGTIIFVILVILIVGFIVIYVHGQMVRKKRREARRRRAMQERAQQNDRRPPTQNYSNSSYKDFTDRY